MNSVMSEMTESLAVACLLAACSMLGRGYHGFRANAGGAGAIQGGPEFDVAGRLFQDGIQ